jgi:hypothetical protein
MQAPRKRLLKGKNTEYISSDTEHQSKGPSPSPSFLQEKEADTWRRKAERLDQEAAAFQRKAADAEEQADTWRTRFDELELRYGALLARLEAAETERQTEVLIQDPSAKNMWTDPGNIYKSLTDT